MNRRMKTLGVLVSASAALAAVIAPSVVAAPGTGAKLTTTISLGGATRLASGSPQMVWGDATFDVTRSIPYDRETIWVTNKCYDARGVLVLRRDAVVLWGTTASLAGTTGPMPTAGTRCTAYVTLKPWADRPLGATLSYGVAY